MVCLFYLTILVGGEMLSHCGFNLCFSLLTNGLNTFHGLFGHFYVFLGEMSTQIFAYF